MPQLKDKKTKNSSKKPIKKEDAMIKKHHDAIGYLLDRVEYLDRQVKKLSSRLGV